MEHAKSIGTLGALLLALSFATPTFGAGPGAMRSGGQGPCAADAQKFCKDVSPGQGRVAGCLKQHEQDLSPACKERMGQAKQQVNAFAQACRDDAAKLCKGIKPGGGRILQCLRSHQQELSPACQSKMDLGGAGPRGGT